MNKAAVFEFLDKATDLVKAAAPLATMLGIPFVEKIAGWADTAVDIGKHTLETGMVAAEVLTSHDEDHIKSKIAELEAACAAMAAAVDAS